MTDAEFNRLCLEKIPPTALRIIADQVLEDVRRVWESEYAPLSLTYCTRCPGGLRHKPRMRCMVDMLTGEALCPSCWAQEHEKDLCRKYLDEHKPKLDLEDFAKV